MLNSKVTMSSLLVCALSAASVSAAVIATDTVEDVGNYTITGAQFSDTRSSGSQGLSAQAGTKFVSLTGGSSAYSGDITFSAGFGAGTLVEEGAYILRLYVGEGDLGRDSFSTFSPHLQTIGGTDFPSPTVDVAYVDPATPSTAEWQQLQISYTIAADSPLIGQQFTWSAAWAKTGTTLSFYGAFDAVTVDFDIAGDSDPPGLQSTSPANGTTGVALDSDLVLTFDEAIKTNTTIDITLTNITDGTSSTFPAAGTVRVVGNVLTIDPSSELGESDIYAILIGDNTILDLSDNAYEGIGDTNGWQFAVRTVVYPVDEFTDDALDAAWTKSLVLTQGDGATVTFDTTTNDDELTWSFSDGNGNAQQHMLLRDDVALTNVGAFIQAKVKLTGADSSSVFMGVAIHETSKTPSSRTGLVSLFITGDGKLLVQKDGSSAGNDLIDEKNYVYLRLKRTSSTTLQGSYSTDGASFTDYGAEQSITGVAAVGFYTGNARSTALGTGVADDFSIYPPPPPDPPAGTVITIK